MPQQEGDKDKQGDDTPRGHDLGLDKQGDYKGDDMDQKGDGNNHKKVHDADEQAQKG